MNTDALSEKLEAAGYHSVADLTIEQSRVDTDAHGQPFYARDHQLAILRGRLRGCQLRDQNNRMVPFLTKWIEEFESVPREALVHHWEGTFKGRRLAGRCIDGKILQIFPQDE
ncbi:MAG: hypothetical protein H0X66_07450 [Verrucomicrobia bacterium]|nr:hypothetical protein [Verrucomicrobiota bacterium]